MDLKYNQPKQTSVAMRLTESSLTRNISTKTKIRNIYLLIIVGFLFVISSSANASVIIWNKIYGGTQDDIGWDFAVPNLADNYIMVGGSPSTISGNKTVPTFDSWGDYWVIKCNSNNTIVWQKRFGGTGHDFATTVLATKDGGYIVGGFSSSPGATGNKTSPNFGSYDYWVVKLNANGVKQWEASYGGSESDKLFEMQETWDGGYVLGGQSSSPKSGSKSEPSRGGDDIWIVKIDSLGNQVWDKTLGGEQDEWFFNLKKSTDGKSYLVGASSYSGIGGEKSQPAVGLSDIWILNIADLGNLGSLIWDKTIGSLGSEAGTLVRQTADGGYVVMCDSNAGIGGDKTVNNHGPLGTTNPDIWVIKLDGPRNIQWQKAVGGTGHEYFKDFLINDSGRYLIAADSDSQISGDKTENPKDTILPGFPIADCWLVEFNPVTQLKTWDKTIGGLGPDASSVIHFADASEKNLLILANAMTGYLDPNTNVFTDWNAGANRTENGYDSQDFWMIRFQP